MDYIGRDTWGAKYAAGTGARPLPCSEAWLHHTVTKHLAVTASPTEERAQMRSVEAIGQSRFGSGFSYNLAIFPSGRVYVGCGVSRVGTHTGGRNTKALGIVLVGDLDKNDVSPQMRAALVGVLRDAKRLGWLPKPALNGGHRDLKQTACPGRFAYRLIQAVNAEAAGQGPAAPPAAAPGTAGPTPTPTVERAVQRGPAMIVVQAPNDARQFLCDASTARHITPQEKAVLNAAGVPYVGEAHATDEERAAFLAERGIGDL